MAHNNQPAAARMAARGHGRGRGRPQTLGVADGGQVAPKSSSGAHFHVRGHEIGHSDEDSSGIGHSGEVSLGRGGYGSEMER